MSRAPYRHHGKSYSQEYRSWKMMHSRCSNPNDPAYKNYGGRGISICKRWNDPSLFIADMGPRPTPKHTLDRINSDKNYVPRNCRWATRREQLQNKRNTVWVIFKDRRMRLKEVSANTGIHYATLTYRNRKGLQLDKRHDRKN